MPQPVPDLEPDHISPAEAQAEVEAVLRSSVFERSERLRGFLRFISELTLKGEGQRINEYLIGSEVFQRGAGYSPSEDSIVRRQAHALRQKLQEYYSTEGRDRDIRIELPVGRYVPLFRRIQALPPPALPPAEVPVPERPVLDTPAVRERPAWILPLVVASCLTAGLLIGRYMPQGAPDTLSPAVRELWSQWLQPGSDAVICFSNPMTAVIKRFDQPIPADAQPKRFRAHADEEVLFRQVFRLPPGGFLYYTPVINQTKMGEAIAGVHLAALLTKAGVTVRSTQSRFLSWEDLRKDNLILLGHNEANEWLEPILKGRPFTLAPTSGSHPRGIVNHQPASGEEREYRITYSQSENDADQEYVLVSMLPGVDGSHPLLLLSGLNAQATQIATEYLASEKGTQELLSRLRTATRNHTGGWYFQAVLRTEVYDKVPTRATLVTVRVL